MRRSCISLAALNCLSAGALAQEPESESKTPKVVFEIEREEDGERQSLLFTGFEREKPDEDPAPPQAERDEASDAPAIPVKKETREVRYLTEAEWAALQREQANKDDTPDPD